MTTAHYLVTVHLNINLHPCPVASGTNRRAHWPETRGPGLRRVREVPA